MSGRECWARKLGDCSDKMSREHVISNAAWPGKDRATRDKHRITASAGVYRAGRIDTNIPGGYLREQTVAGLTKRVLCTHHNSELSGCDEGAREFTAALDGFWKTCIGRPYETLSYTSRTFSVDAMRLQRWFLKTVITFAVGGELPIGGSGASPGFPTDELVDIAFGRAPPYGYLGLWTLDVPPQKIDQLRGFSFRPWRRVFENNEAAPFIAGCFTQFRGLWFSVNLEPYGQPPTPQLPMRSLSRPIRFVRFGEVAVDDRNVRLRFD